jgi:uncharacterized protein YjbJ (UPF0337 family)
MNFDQVQANGTPSTGQMKEKWSALTDNDLEAIAGKKDQLAGKLQERYGYGKEQAEREVEEFLRTHSEGNGSVSPRTTEPPRVPVLPSPAHREGPSPPASTAAASLAPLAPFQGDRPQTQRPEAGSPPASDYTHSATLWLSPRVLRWVAPVGVVTLVVLLFLPWTGAYPGGYGVHTQNAFQAIWGGVSVDPVGAKALASEKPNGDVGVSGLMLFYTLLVLLALVLVLAPLALTPGRVQALPPMVRSLSRWRLGLLGAVALVAFLLLIIQLWTDFGLEAAVAAGVDNNLASELAAAKTSEAHKMANIQRGLQLSQFNIHRTLWFHLAVLSHMLLLVGLGLELWLKRRGPRPLPRIIWQA